MGWISVKDEIPEWGEEVVLTDGEDVAAGYLLKESGVWLDWGGNEWETTHWQPLPDPPSGKEASTPEHYLGDGVITCEDAERSMLTDTDAPPMVISWWGQAFQYLWRWRRKNGIEDIDKCINCLNKIKKELS